jgi:L-lactate dehydrogenase complex protein LldG
VSAKTEILARIDRALRHRTGPPAITRGYHQAGTRSHLELVTLFEERLLDYRAAVRRCPATAVPDTIAAALADHGVRRVLAPDGLPADWLASGQTDVPPLSALDLASVDGVVTTCAVAIAQTGTIVLDHGPGQGRRALTLIPDYHLVVVRAEQIVHAVPDAIAALDPHPPMTWISGPSATSDIELERVEGVHGPRQLAVVIALPA